MPVRLACPAGGPARLREHSTWISLVQCDFMCALSTTRRKFLSFAAALPAFATSAKPTAAEAQPDPSPAGRATRARPIPPPGVVFNESFTVEDPITGRMVRRLTQHRTFNQTPTYHLNAGFSSDSASLVLATWNENAESAILFANVATGDLKVIAVTEPGDLRRFNGNNVCVLPKSGWIAAKAGKSRLNVYDPRRAELVVAVDAGSGLEFGHPAGAADGRSVYVPRQPFFRRGVDNPHECVGLTLVRIDVPSGRMTEVFHDPASRSNHVVPSPVDADWVLLDRDLPPLFGHGGIGPQRLISRAWVLNTSSGELHEVRPRNINRFAIHSNWSFDGKFVYYHGRSETDRKDESDRGRRHYVGVADAKGAVVWEREFPYFYYGHIGSHTRKHVMLTDALFAENLLTAIHWQDRDGAGVPRLEILGSHDTIWGSSQASHPHPLMSPDGRWISYNRGLAHGSDVYTLDVA